MNQPTQIRDGIPTRPCERCVKSAKMCVLGYDGRRCRACIGSRKGCSLTGLRYPRYNKGESSFYFTFDFELIEFGVRKEGER